MRLQGGPFSVCERRVGVAPLTRRAGRGQEPERSGRAGPAIEEKKTEFGKFGGVLDRVQRQLRTVTQTIEETGTRAARKIADAALEAAKFKPTADGKRMVRQSRRMGSR
jgi:hypothetical protein